MEAGSWNIELSYPVGSPTLFKPKICIRKFRLLNEPEPELFRFFTTVTHLLSALRRKIGRRTISLCNHLNSLNHRFTNLKASAPALKDWNLIVTVAKNRKSLSEPILSSLMLNLG